MVQRGQVLCLVDQRQLVEGEGRAEDSRHEDLIVEVAGALERLADAADCAFADDGLLQPAELLLDVMEEITVIHERLGSSLPFSGRDVAAGLAEGDDAHEFAHLRVELVLVLAGLLVDDFLHDAEALLEVHVQAVAAEGAGPCAIAEGVEGHADAGWWEAVLHFLCDFLVEGEA